MVENGTRWRRRWKRIPKHARKWTRRQNVRRWVTRSPVDQPTDVRGGTQMIAPPRELFQHLDARHRRNAPKQGVAGVTNVPRWRWKLYGRQIVVCRLSWARAETTGSARMVAIGAWMLGDRGSQTGDRNRPCAISSLAVIVHQRRGPHRAILARYVPQPPLRIPS